VTFRSGFVCVAGRPNTGKSTLVNALVGSKVAITSDRPQTTRSAVRGILTRDDYQIVFIDTPGYHKPRTLLGERLNEVVRAAWAGVDLAVLVFDASAGIGRGDRRIVEDCLVPESSSICVVNKIDIAKRGNVAASLKQASEIADFAEFVPASAATGEGLDVLERLIVERVPEGPMFYPRGTSSDQPPRAFVSELIREKLLARMHEEMPHSIAITIEEYEERADGLLAISARINVERASQKTIVIGSGGSRLKVVGTESRHEIEVLFGRRVFLDLRVRVEKDWQRREAALDRLGFGGFGL
jgi:GTP-binding protein Era